MKDLSTDLLLSQLEYLMSAYKRTDIVFAEDYSEKIADDRGADLLRLLYLVTEELINRIELPF